MEVIADDVETKRTRTILLVDDDHLVLNMLHTVLTRSGYQVHAEIDSVRACLELERGDVVPDAIVTDLSMARMNGTEMAQRMLAKQPDLPIVFISGNPTAQLMPTIESFPNHVLLTKPFLPSHLLNVLASFLHGGDDLLRNAG